MKAILYFVVAVMLIGCGKKNETKDAPKTEETLETTEVEETATEATEATEAVEEAPKELSVEEKTRICALPMQKGNCKAELKRFGYDAEKNVCEQFTYTGCGGNENAFRSRADCEATCEKSEEVTE